MQIFEDDAKGFFRDAGISVPRFFIADSVDGAVGRFGEIDSRVVVKPIGIKGRGKLGLVRFTDSEEGLRSIATEMLGKEVGGKRISKLIVEETIPSIKRELYLAITIDDIRRSVVAVFSTQGGVDIEETSRLNPGAIAKIPISISKGIDRAELEAQLSGMALGTNSGKVIDAIEGAYSMFRKYDAELLEINPLVITGDDRVLALDALVNVNDDSLFRHPELAEIRQKNNVQSGHEKRMAELGWSYVDLDGNIGIVCSGAGLTMATLDMLNAYGGRAANFLDMAQVDGDGLYKALDIIMEKKELGCVFVNLFAGLNDCKKMAEGIARYNSERKPPIPIIARVVGNNEDEGFRIFSEAQITNLTSLEDAAKMVTQVVNDGNTGR
ncbi:MAG: succinate--CoA ligase subunit beta [Candidatus Micrarchaeota archaeon]|nr:succinate--CoA ligase subunit beta [Candidatus Micrarchaeota archaeon]